MTGRFRIAIAGWQHESNTASPFGATFADFAMADGWPSLTVGPAMLEIFPPLNIPLGGFLRAGGFDCVPIAWASAEPSGPVSDDAFSRLSNLICDGIAGAGSLDGIYLDLHGAMVTDSNEDGEGELLRRLRKIVGDTLPIVVSLDMHANVTDAMMRYASAIVVYRTYPHIDMAETGTRAAALMQAWLTGPPIFKAFRKLDYLIPLSAQCTDLAPLNTIYSSLSSHQSTELLSADIAIGFPSADILECGPAILTYGLDQASADACADALLASLYDAEQCFDNPLHAVDDAIALAMSSRDGPVVLADVQDNPGAGGTADTTGLLRGLVAAGCRRTAIAVLWDPAIVASAHRAGVGAEITAQLGSRYGYDAVPFIGRFRIEAISDGNIVGHGAIIGGATMALGPMARLRLLDTKAEIDIVVSSVRFQCLDQALFRAMGIEPRNCAILVVKSTIHFRADFDAIAAEILMVRSPGAHACSIDVSTYRRLRPGMRTIGSHTPGGDSLRST